MSKQSYFAADNLSKWFPLHHLYEPRWNYTTGLDVIDPSKKSLWAFVGMVVFNPVFWNLVARNEYHNKSITKIVKSPYVGCYLLASTIFSFSAFRDSLFLGAVKSQPALAILDNPAVRVVAAALFGVGQLFVVSSMWMLGVSGTYLGDYFGILMSHRVTGFPFNVLNDPMYIGSFLTHIGTALWFDSPAGVLLSFWVLGVYLAALRFEGPFTDMIYSAASKKSATSTSTSTPSARVTPTRKSSRLALKASSEKLRSDSDFESYAQAAAEPRGAGGLPSATPRKTRTSALKNETGTASPRRMTRSRSQGRGIGSEESD